MKDKIVLIAGGTGGIGQATAELFSKAGATVVLASRSREKADEVALNLNRYGGNAYAIDLDVTEPGSVYGMAEMVAKEFGKIDVLINAFGTGMIQPVLDANPDEIKNVIDVNVFGTILVTQAVLRHMVSVKQGSIIMIPGILGKAVMRNSSIYSASKFAVSGFTKALIEEHRRNNISFTLMYLGGVATPFWESDQIDMRVQKDKMLTPEEVAKAIYYAVNQPTGSVLNEMVIQPESHQMT